MTFVTKVPCAHVTGAENHCFFYKGHASATHAQGTMATKLPCADAVQTAAKALARQYGETRKDADE